MLHDPRHDKTPSLAGFALFVATKDPDERYNYSNCYRCAVGQYARSLGTTFSQLAHGSTRDLLEEINDLARPSPKTFGALADRILAYQVKTKKRTIFGVDHMGDME